MLVLYNRLQREVKIEITYARSSSHGCHGHQGFFVFDVEVMMSRLCPNIRALRQTLSELAHACIDRSRTESPHRQREKQPLERLFRRLLGLWREGVDSCHGRPILECVRVGLQRCNLDLFFFTFFGSAPRK